MTEINIGSRRINVEALLHNWEQLNLKCARLEIELTDAREAAASCCDYLAGMLERGAGDHPKGARLRQAARLIRAGVDKREYPVLTKQRKRATPKRSEER